GNQPPAEPAQGAWRFRQSGHTVYRFSALDHYFAEARPHSARITTSLDTARHEKGMFFLIMSEDGSQAQDSRQQQTVEYQLGMGAREQHRQADTSRGGISEPAALDRLLQKKQQQREPGGRDEDVMPRLEHVNQPFAREHEADSGHQSANRRQP